MMIRNRVFSSLKHELKLLGSLVFMMGLAAASHAQEKKAAMPSSHICYFSMNNGKEFPELEKFLTRLNKASPNLKITVAEYQTEGSNPEESFRMMLRDLKAEGRHCDGLVLSGHHTGSFSGMRASGTLGVEFLESLSCEPANREFFSKIQSVWLQGCRTMGVCKVAFGTDAERQQFAGQVLAQTQTAEAAAAPAHSADFHTERVGAVLAEDHLTQSYAQLNTEFSATLDQDNPLSTRYLRIFPRAAVFGWTATAPGPVAKSEYSLPYHIAHTTKHMDDRKELFQNPQQVLNENSARAYGSTLKGMLHRDHSELSKGCVGDACQKGWMDQASSKTMGYGTTEANALPPLVSGNSQALLRAKALECEIKNPSSPEAHAKALREILEDPTQVAYNFNSLWELLQKAENEGDDKKLAELREQYGKSIPLANFLNHKFKDPSLGTLRKIDYYAFYRDMMGKKNDVIEGRILEAAKSIILKETTSTDQRDYQQTMIQSLAKNGLLSDGFVEEIMSGSQAHPDSKLELLNSIPSEKFTPKASFFQSIAADPRATPETFSTILGRISGISHEMPGQDAILSQIIGDNRSTADTLGQVAEGLRWTGKATPQAEQFLTQIINDPRSTDDTLGAAAHALISERQSYPQREALLNQIMSDKRASEKAYVGVADTLSETKQPIKQAQEMLEQIVNDSSTKGVSLTYVAQALRNEKQNYPKKIELLEKILDDKRTYPSGLDSVAETVTASSTPIPNAAKLLQKAISHPAGDYRVTYSLVEGIGNSKHPIEGADKLLEQAMTHKGSTWQTMEKVGEAIGATQHPIPRAEELIKQLIANERFGDTTLMAAANAVGNSKHPIAGSRAILDSLLTHKNTSKETVSAVARAIGSAQRPIENPDEVLERVLKHRDSDESVLNDVVSAIKDSKLPLKDPKGILTRVMKDPRSSDWTIAEVTDALAQTKQHIPDADAFLQSLLKAPQAGSVSKSGYISALLSGRFKSIDAEKEIKSYLQDTEGPAYALPNVVQSLSVAKVKVQNPRSLIKSAIQHPQNDFYSLERMKISLENKLASIDGREELIEMIVNKAAYRNGPEVPEYTD